MSDKTYNGWTNYETWRVNLEIFDGFDLEEYFQLNINECDLDAISDNLKDYAEEVIFECASVPDGLARDYAQAFLEAVNWREIAEHMIEDAKEEA
jgi:hypothetical protein